MGECQRKGLSPDIIREELVRGRGTQFDPNLLDVFLTVVDDGEADKVTENANKLLTDAIEIGLIEKASDWIHDNNQSN